MIPEIPVSERAALLAQQHTHLVTGGHVTRGLCFAEQANGELCPRWATMRIERLDYLYGVTMGVMFRPGLTLTHVCDECAEILRGEPGLIVLAPINCPPELLAVPSGQVYRPSKAGRCRWINCDETPLTGYFCDPHRRWHVQRLLRQMRVAAEKSSTGRDVQP